MASIKKGNVRFIIPFSFQLDKVNTFEKQCQSIETVMKGKQPLWKKINIGDSECDLYDSVQNAIAGESGSFQNLGAMYRLNQGGILHTFRKTVNMISMYEVDITDLGLYIFESGIAFFWYGIKLENTNPNDILTINNDFKEISYSGKNNVLYEVVEEKNICAALTDCVSVIADCEIEQYVTVLSKKRCYLHKNHIPLDILSQENTKYYIKGDSICCSYTRMREIQLYELILDYLSPFNIKSFFSSRKKTVNDEVIRIPDKALIFSSIFTDTMDKKENLSYLFWLGKGYSRNYSVPEDFLSESQKKIFSPFSNIRWYASLEGCAQLINEAKGNNEFFYTTYWNRNETYFYLYILTLHQYYGLLEIDNDISYLPNCIEGYNKVKYRSKLSDYKERTNFFLMKTIFIQVSHITHQNEFYNYLKKIYAIEYSMEEILKEITTMNQLIDDWMNKRKENRISILSIIGGIFAFIQTFNNILGVYDYLPFGNLLSLYEFTALSMAASVLIGIVVWLIGRYVQR